PPLNTMTLAVERLGDTIGDWLFEIEQAWRVGVRRERIREALGIEPRRLYRPLNALPEDERVQHKLQHSLRLVVATRRSEGHDEATVLHCERWIRRQARPFARCDAGRVQGVHSRLDAA